MIEKGKILMTGTSGLVGSRVFELLSKQFTILPIRHGQYDELERIMNDSPGDFLIHFGAYFPGVDQIEKERESGKVSKAWQANVELTKKIARICGKEGIHLIFASSTYVFDGEHGPYSERDDPNISNSDIMSFYGIIKRASENVIQDNCGAYSLIRFEMPFRANFLQKLDFARWILKAYQEKTLPPMFSNQRVTPIFIDELAKVVQLIISSQSTGVFHVGSLNVTSPYEFASDLIFTAYGEGGVVEESTYSQSPPREGNARRPLASAVLMENVLGLGYKPLTTHEMLEEFLSQPKK